MKTIILHTNSLNERGTSVAVYDYALHVKEYLNLNPIIVYNLNSNNYQSSVEYFKKQFKVIGYENFESIQQIVDKKNIDYFYAIKYGTKDNVEIKNCKNLIHSVFCSDVSEIHGDRYATVSEWLSKKANCQIPFVPHILNLPENKKNFKDFLGIPNDAIVVGRYGSKETFNIDFVPNTILKVLEKRSDIWFLFLNTEKNIYHDRCLYFDTIIDLNEKVSFINTCDAMLHARDYGETFGLSVLEFASKNKQIISYDNEILQSNHPLGGRNHFLFLKDNCFKYQDENTLESILLNITKNNPFDTRYLNQEFSPQSVIKKFDEVFIR
jgi:hypothetical protein